MHCGGVHLSPPPPLSHPAQLHRQLQYHLALQLFIHTSIHGRVLPGPVIKKSLVISFLNPPSPFLFPPFNELATYARLFTYVFYDFISCKNKQFCYNVYWLVLATGIGAPKGSACFLMCP